MKLRSKALFSRARRQHSGMWQRYAPLPDSLPVVPTMIGPWLVRTTRTSFAFGILAPQATQLRSGTCRVFGKVGPPENYSPATRWSPPSGPDQGHRWRFFREGPSGLRQQQLRHHGTHHGRRPWPPRRPSGVGHHGRHPGTHRRCPQRTESFLHPES